MSLEYILFMLPRMAVALLVFIIALRVATWND
jgi:hypothetical protein